MKMMMSTGACLFPPYFSCLVIIIIIFYFRIYCRFLSYPCSFMEIDADLVFVRAQAAILWSSGHSVKEIAKFLKKTEQ